LPFDCTPEVEGAITTTTPAGDPSGAVVRKEAYRRTKSSSFAMAGIILSLTVNNVKGK
jgi:hypothetical protein